MGSAFFCDLYVNLHCYTMDLGSSDIGNALQALLKSNSIISVRHLALAESNIKFALA